MFELKLDVLKPSYWQKKRIENELIRLRAARHQKSLNSAMKLFAEYEDQKAKEAEKTNRNQYKFWSEGGF